MALALGAALLVANASPARAQYVPPNKRAATPAELIGGNMLIGGLTAATRALLTGKDPLRAFAVGSAGGAVVLAGKYLAVEPGTGLIGLALSGTGTSIVSNAGRGVGAFDEVTLALPALRLRVSPRAARDKVRLSVNAYEAVLVAQYVFRADLNLDWTHTLATGGLVFNADYKHVEFQDTKVDGAAIGPVAIVSAFARDPEETARHEVVHVYQAWFEQEAWGRPIESAIRARIPFADRIPRWLDLGLGAPVLSSVEHALVGRRGTTLLGEAEAESLARR